MKVTVEMTVTVTVEPPAGQSPDDEAIKDMAMSAVSQFHEVECGRGVGPHENAIAWAKVYAEVTEEECEIVERTQ